jgi:hypothetical protein
MGAAGLLSEARNLPARNDNQLLSGMQSNQAMLDQMGFQMRQLNDRLKVDFPAEQHAFTTGKQLASNIRTEHHGDQQSMREDFQKHDVRGIFVHGYREGKENAFNELGDFKNLQSKLTEVSGGKGQQPGDSQSAAATMPDTNKFANPQGTDKFGNFANKDQLTGGKLDLTRGNTSEMAARAALLLGDLTNKPNGAQPADEFGRMIKFVEGRLNNPPTDSHQKHNNDNKSVELTHNQYDAMNAQHRNSTEQHIFNAYVANLAGSVIDRLTHNEHHSEGMLGQPRHASQTEKVDQTAAVKQIANDKVQQDQRDAARSRQEAELAAQRSTEKETNIKGQERAQDKQTRQDGGEKTANSNVGEQQRADQVVHDPTANQESADVADSVTRALSDLTGLLTNIGDTAKEKFNLQPILKLKMLMKMRIQIMQKFRLMWKAKSKLLDKLKMKKREKAKAKLKVVANRKKQSNQRRGELQRSENRKVESSKRQRDAQREERQRPEQPTDIRQQDRQRLEARRTSMRQTDSGVARVANLDAARTLRQAVVSRSEAAPQHHVTEVSCIGRPTEGQKQSLFGPMNCGNPTGIVKIPQLTDASFGVSTAVTTTARRA